MGWGDIFSDPGILSTVAGVFGGNTGKLDFSLPTLATGAAQAYQLSKTAKASDRAKSDYAGALASQRTAGTELSQNARKMMQDDALLRQSLLEQTGTLGTQLQSVYNQLGPLPAVTPETIAADYGALRGQSMDDFAGLVKGFTASQQAQNLTQLGGARNPAMEDYQLNQNLKKFAPIQQQLDTASYAEAVNRANQQSGALSSNRNQIMQQIVSALGPQLEAERGLYRPDLSANAASTGANIMQSYLSPAAEAGKVYTEEASKGQADLNATIAKIFGTGPQPETAVPAAPRTTSAADIVWNKPATAAPTAPKTSVIPGGFTPAPGTSTPRQWWEVENRAFTPIPGFK